MHPVDNERRFRMRVILACFLCSFGILGYISFLTYRHSHPFDTTPVKQTISHQSCPHLECESHERLTRPEESATGSLGGLLLLYCALVGLGSFMVEVPK